MIDIFSEFEKLNVLIVGDVMIDRYLHGKADRISPEAPVPVVLMESQEDRLGGAANVALNIAALGATPYLCSVVGKDAAAQTFLQLLDQHQLPNKYIIQSSERPTTIKSRISANHQQLLRLDQESQVDLSPIEEQHYLKTIDAILVEQKIDVVLFQDYNKGVLSTHVIQTVIAQAKAYHLPIAVDPKFKNFNAYQGVHLFKPNLVEVSRFFQQNIAPISNELRVAAEKIHLALNNQYTLITLSDKGLYLSDKNIGTIHPTQVRKIADVCGAGDSVISIVALALALQLSSSDMALLANLAGGQVCESPGVVPINLEQLKQEYFLTNSAIGQK